MQNELSRSDNRKLKTILAKKQAGRALTYEEEQFAKAMFDTMVDSKAALYKTVKFLTGEQIRKSAVDNPALRREDHPRNVDEIEDEDADPTPDVLRSKMPDADAAKDSDITEEKRLADATQRTIPPSVGDTVAKSFGHTRKVIFKGIVISANSKVAMVKWADGRITGEPLSQLIKATELEAKTAAEEKGEDEEVTPPVKKKAQRSEKNPNVRVRYSEGHPKGKLTEEEKEVEKFDESKIRRDEDGKFAPKSGTGSGSKKPSAVGRAARRAAVVGGAVALGAAALYTKMAYKPALRAVWRGFLKDNPRVRPGMYKIPANVDLAVRAARRSAIKVGLASGALLGTAAAASTATGELASHRLSEAVRSRREELDAAYRRGRRSTRKISKAESISEGDGVLGVKDGHSVLGIYSGDKRIMVPTESGWSEYKMDSVHLIFPGERVPDGKDVKADMKAAKNLARVARNLEQGQNEEVGKECTSRMRRKYSKKVAKNGDVFGDNPSVPHPAGGHHTPFEDLTDTLHDIIHTARTVKSRRDRANDEEIIQHYEGILDELRTISEHILAGLSVELEEAEYTEDE